MAGEAGGESPILGASGGKDEAKRRPAQAPARKAGDTGLEAGAKRRDALTAPGAKSLSA
jgi:hypothetical protein